MGDPLNHRQTFELLPWYANGTLEDAERQRVRAHLGSCLVCRRELGFLEDLGRHLTQGDDVLFSPQRSLAAVLERVEAAEAPWERRLRIHLRKGLHALQVAHPLLRGALLVQAVVIVLAGVLLVRPPAPERAPRYETLSEAVSTPPAAADTLRLHVVFAASTPMEAIAGLLEPAGARIVDGPSSAGVLSIEVPAQAGPALLAQLRGAEEVSFAEQVASAARP